MALLRRCLISQGHRVLETGDGHEGLRIALAEKPDAIVMDVNLPSLSGFEICDALRNASFYGAILMLTARDSMDDKLTGLSRGADDYICKPFDVRELMARVAALLRRHTWKSLLASSCRVGDVEIDIEQRRASKAGRELSLTKTEWSLLKLLLQNAGKPVSRDKMLDAVWGYDHYPSTRTIDTHVWRLRRKLSGEGPLSGPIEKVQGEGYRFVPNSESQD